MLCNTVQLNLTWITVLKCFTNSGKHVSFMSDFIINVKENKHNLVAFMNQNNPINTASGKQPQLWVNTIYTSLFKQDVL